MGFFHIGDDYSGTTCKRGFEEAFAPLEREVRQICGKSTEHVCVGVCVV